MLSEESDTTGNTAGITDIHGHSENTNKIAVRQKGLSSGLSTTPKGLFLYLRGI